MVHDMVYVVNDIVHDTKPTMPPKKKGEGAQARYNAKKPTITFRCDADFRDALYASASRAGKPIGAHIIQLLREGIRAKPKPRKPVVTEWISGSVSDDEWKMPDYTKEMPEPTQLPEPTYLDEMKRQQLDNILKDLDDGLG